MVSEPMADAQRLLDMATEVRRLGSWYGVNSWLASCAENALVGMAHALICLELPSTVDRIPDFHDGKWHLPLGTYNPDAKLPSSSPLLE